jgi:hypothetical protein
LFFFQPAPADSNCGVFGLRIAVNEFFSLMHNSDLHSCDPTMYDEIICETNHVSRI